MKTKNKTRLYLIIIVLAIASLSYRVLSGMELKQTSLLFVGIPTIITLLLVRYSKKPKSAYGVAFLTITLFLLISGIFLGEGFVCILFMAPIFYAVTAVLVWLYEFLKKKGKSKTYSFAVLPLLFLLFQPSEFVKEKTIHSIKTEKIIASNIALNSLNKSPDFLENLPRFFKIGFPKPIKIKGGGLEKGAIRIIDFKSQTKGIGALKLKVNEVSKNKVVFDIVSDKTHIGTWLTYKKVTVEIVEKDGVKKVIWTTNFTCDLGPSWYFEEFEKYAINLMNLHLINSYFI